VNFKFTDFSSFLNAVESIISIELQKAREILKTTGKDITNISDILVNDNGLLFDILPDGTITRVNLYIAIKSIDTRAINYIKSEDLYKYHIYKCKTISEMFNSGRKHRYKINNRDDGTFFFTFTDFRGRVIKKEENQKLNICKNCLRRFLGRYPTEIDVRNFNLKEFHKKKANFFDFDTSNMEKGEFATPNIYSENWNIISKKVKEKRNYTCENCGFTPSNNYEKRFIHTHHINGDKQNNLEDNLKVLCIKCHSDIDIYHKRIKVSSNYKEFIEKIFKTPLNPTP
jgi:hypothetical protein